MILRLKNSPFHTNSNANLELDVIARGYKAEYYFFYMQIIFLDHPR